jgi:hypothetical protein
MNDGELSKRIDDLHKRFDDLRADMNARFALIDKRIDDLRNEMVRRFEELTGQVGRLENQVVSRMDRFEARFEGRLGRLEDRLWWIVGIQIGTWITIMIAILFRR